MQSTRFVIATKTKTAQESYEDVMKEAGHSHENTGVKQFGKKIEHK